MKKETQKYLFLAVFMLSAFLLWTAAIRSVDVQNIGPQESSVGLAAINQFVHNLTGVHMSLYTVTDWLGLVPLVFILVFAFIGLTQWFRRKSLIKVDYSILVLGVFYIVVMAVYILFEVFVVNYRPVLIAGYMEASYPSSTTMLVMCVMPTAAMQINSRLKNEVLRHCVSYAITLFTVFMVIGRLISGVHWFSDIVGGLLLSAGLVLFYKTIISLEVR